MRSRPAGAFQGTFVQGVHKTSRASSLIPVTFLPLADLVRGLVLCPFSKIARAEAAFAQPLLALCIAILSKSTAHENVTSPERAGAGEMCTPLQSSGDSCGRPLRNRGENLLLGWQRDLSTWCGCGSLLERRARPQRSLGFGTPWSARSATVWLAAPPAHRPPSAGVGRKLYLELF
jgi:hypothetical protein